MNITNKTLESLLLTPHLKIICKQDSRRCHQLHLCDCPECRDTDRFEEQRDCALNDRYDEARDMQQELEKDDDE